MTLSHYVLFPMGHRRFAMRSDRVAEFARPSRVYAFPHTTPLVQGVLVRRGRLIPVFDLAEVLAETPSSARPFYLIARRSNGASNECAAIPVTGECELVNASEQPCSGKLPRYVTGMLSLPAPGGKGEESVAVVDLEELLHSGTPALSGIEGAEERA